MLYPYLKESDIIKIFAKNLYDDENLTSLFEELL